MNTHPTQQADARILADSGDLNAEECERSLARQLAFAMKVPLLDALALRAKQRQARAYARSGDLESELGL